MASKVGVFLVILFFITLFALQSKTLIEFLLASIVFLVLSLFIIVMEKNEKKKWDTERRKSSLKEN